MHGGSLDSKVRQVLLAVESSLTLHVGVHSPTSKDNPRRVLHTPYCEEPYGIVSGQVLVLSNHHFYEIMLSVEGSDNSPGYQFWALVYPRRFSPN